MSGRRGRPTGDRYEEPGGYDPAAIHPGEAPLDPGPPGPGYGEQAFAPPGEYYGEQYGTPAAESYDGRLGGYAEPGQYAQPPADQGSYGYPAAPYPPETRPHEPYPQDDYAQGSYPPESYSQEPYLQDSYPQGPQAPQAPHASHALQPYAEPLPSAPAAGGYGYPDATEMLPALAEPGRDGYDSGYADRDGATSVLPAVVEPVPESEPDSYGGYRPEDAHRRDESVDHAAFDHEQDHPEFAHDFTHAHDHPNDAPADDDAPADSRRRLARVPAQRTGEASARSARTPIWDPPGMLPALCTVGLAAVLAVTAIAGKPALVLGVAFLQVLTAAGWFRLNGMWPARQGIALVVVAAFGTDIAVYAKGEQGLASVPAVLAATLLVMLALQARSGARPGELLPALTVTTSAALITAFDVAYLVAGELHGGPIDAGAAVVSAVLAAGVATLVRAVPLPPAVAPIPSWLLGTAAGAAAGIALGGEAPYAALLGAAASALGLLGRRVAGYDHPSGFVHFTAGVSLPLALAAPAAYLLGRVMIG
ncbi:hypothetical protein [Embleya scabrispora]|uniref:hypothetical protein n=1 Tax=Embleya scabrispora TaxID=159449 RepID=UPI00037A6515|nr:hypothetical protein [Embleya scabrispora]MYS79916.1 hypothetical protein [Streptomyces sp. SID5474]